MTATTNPNRTSIGFRDNRPESTKGGSVLSLTTALTPTQMPNFSKPFVSSSDVLIPNHLNQ
ncbi:MAG: hypothetical protein AAGA96_20510 [Verrucomicrobiota bacterium]